MSTPSDTTTETMQEAAPSQDEQERMVQEEEEDDGSDSKLHAFVDSRRRSRNLKILLVVCVLGTILALALVIAIPKGSSSKSSSPVEEEFPTFAPTGFGTLWTDGEIDPTTASTPPPQEVERLPVPDEMEIVLLSGKYTTTRDVTSELSLTLDVQDILAKNATDTDGQQLIYVNGSRSFSFDENGNEIPRSLADLSLKAVKTMALDPFYNIFRQAFLDVGAEEVDESFGDFDDEPVEHYANTLVMDLFALRRGNYIEVRAALVLNVWMAVAHELNSVLTSCRKGEDKGFMEAALDRAAALWIGNGQSHGDNHNGNMLYHFTENAGIRFGQDPEILEDATVANKFIVDNLVSMQEHVAQDKCDDEDSYADIRNMVDTIQGYMTVPLVQDLIYSITQRLGDWTELYALAFLPRVAFCDPPAYDNMMRLMVLNDLKDSDMQEAFDTIESIMGKCLHVTCDMIGTLQDVTDTWFPVIGNTTTIISTPCQISDVDFSPRLLAGYRLSDNVDRLSHIDNDIFQIRMLLRSYAYDAALDYYQYGQNSRPKGELLSLRELATSDVRENAPQFALFSESYADSVIIAALTRRDPFDKASPNQITEVVVGVLQSMVMYVAVLQSLYIAVSTCRSKTDETDVYGFSRKDFTDHFVHIWDVGVAFYIGSLEGEGEGGTDNGVLLYHVAKDLCAAFGTCANSVHARVNKNLVRAFGDGKHALTLNDCDGAASILESEIVPDLMVPLIQGTLFYAEKNAELEAGTREASLGAGFAFSRGVLPFVYDDNREAAELVATNTDFQLESQPVPDGIEAVYDAIMSTVVSGDSKVKPPMVLSKSAATIELTE